MSIYGVLAHPSSFAPAHSKKSSQSKSFIDFFGKPYYFLSCLLPTDNVKTMLSQK